MAVPSQESRAKKKADVVESPEGFNHAGLLFNGLPGLTESPFI